MEFKVARGTALPSTGVPSRLPVPAPLSPGAFGVQAVSQRDPAPRLGRGGGRRCLPERGRGGRRGAEQRGGKVNPEPSGAQTH